MAVFAPWGNCPPHIFLVKLINCLLDGACASIEVVLCFGVVSLHYGVGRIFIAGVRCFAAQQNFRIRPLTFLVRENSTGKTTALGCFQVLASCLTDKGADFNRDPYEMGNFNHIISTAADKGTFELGFTVNGEKEKIERVVEFAKSDSSVEPVVKSIATKFSDGQIVLKIGEQNSKPYDKKTGTYSVNFKDVPRELPPLTSICSSYTHIRSRYY